METVTEQKPETILDQATLSDSISDLISDKLAHKKTHKISDLYKSILNVIEPPMLDAIMAFTRYNQSKAAKCLGLSKSTLRKKLIQHFDDKYCSPREGDE